VPAPEVAFVYNLSYTALFDIRCQHWDWDWLPRYQELMPVDEPPEETNTYALLLEIAPKYNVLRPTQSLVIRGYVGPKAKLHKELKGWGLIKGFDYFLKWLRPKSGNKRDNLSLDCRLVKATEKPLICNY
jgi:hypothetical protein